MQNDSSQQKELKQTFLREQILTQGYDPQQFVTFLNQQLQIDSDIDKCSLRELEEVVGKFKQLKKLQESQSPEQIRVTLPQNQESKVKKKQILFKQFIPHLIEQQFCEEVKCIKVVEKHPNRQNYRCQLSLSPERKYVGGVLGIGSTSFLQFKITTHGPNWCVGRRYSDFIWLRNVLLKFYPSQIIPPIPNKKAAKRSNTHIEKRMRILTYFLNDLIGLTEVFNSRYVEGFLSLKDLSKFDKLKEQADNKRVFECISSTETLSGKCKVELTQQNVQYYSQINKYVLSTQSLYKNITRNSKKLQRSIIQQVNTMYEIGNQFGELHESASLFRQKIKSQNMTKLQDIYVTLNNLMIQWGNHLKNEVDLLEVNFITFFKYVRQQFMGYKELFAKEALLQDEWSKAKITLDKKKQKIFALHDTTKWQLPKSQINFLSKSCVHQRKEAFNIMLPKQSVIVEEIKKNMAYYLCKIQQHCEDHFAKTLTRFGENFGQFSIKNKVTVQQVSALWIEMSARFSEPNKKGKIKMMPKIQINQQNERQEQDND